MANISASTRPYFIYLDNDFNLSMSGASGNSIYEYNVNRAIKRGSSLITNANVYKGVVYKDEDADSALVEKIGDRFLGNLEVPFPAIWEDGDGFKPHAGQYGIFTVDSPSAGRQKIFYAYAIKGKGVSNILAKYNYLSEPINGHACPEQKLPFTVVWDRNNTCDTSMLYPLEGAWVTLEGSATTHTVEMSDWSNAVVFGYNIRQKSDTWSYLYNANGTTLNITIPENNSKYERKFAVNVSQSPITPYLCNSNTFYFFQKSNLFFNLITSAVTIGATGGTVDFYYNTNMDLDDLRIKVDGLEGEVTSVNSGYTSISFPANDRTSVRSGKVEFYLYMDLEEPDRLLGTTYVTQEAASEQQYFHLITDRLFPPAEGGTFDVFFNTNIPVSALTLQRSIVEPVSYTFYSNKLTITLPPNDWNQVKYYSFSFATGGTTIWDDGLPAIFTCLQDAPAKPSYYFNLITTEATVPASGGTARIYYDTNLPVSAVTVSWTADDSVSVADRTSGYTDFAFEGNYSPTGAEKTVYAFFTYTINGVMEESTAEITQTSLPYLQILDAETIVPNTQGEIRIRVSTDLPAAQITVTSSDWLTFQTRTVSGDTLVYTFSYAAYTGTTERRGSVTFITPYGEYNASVIQMYRYFRLGDPKDTLLPSSGGVVPITYYTNIPPEEITASCKWARDITLGQNDAYVTMPQFTGDGYLRAQVVFEYKGIQNDDRTKQTEVFTIYQLGGEAYSTLVNSAVTISSEEQDVSIYFYTNIPNRYLPREADPDSAYNSLTSKNGEVVIHMRENTGETRTLTITFTNVYLDSSRTAYVCQLSPGQYFNLVTTALTLDWSGGTAVVEYDTNLPIDYVSGFTSHWASIVFQDDTSVTIEYETYTESGNTRNGYVDFRTPLGEYEVALVQPGPETPGFRFLTASERTFDSGTTAVTVEWETTYSAVSYTYNNATYTTTASSMTFCPPLNVWTEPQDYYIRFFLETEPYRTDLGTQKITILGASEVPIYTPVKLYIRSSQAYEIPESDYYREGAVRWDWKGVSSTILISYSGITTLSGIPWWEFDYDLSEDRAANSDSYLTITNLESQKCTALGDYVCDKRDTGDGYVFTWERTPYHTEEVIIGEGVTRLGSEMKSSVTSRFNPDTYTLGDTYDYFFPNPYVIPSSAQYIELPRTLRRIEPYVFYQCVADKIYYNGTMDQWKGSVSLAPNWCYPAGQWTVVCTDGNLEY